MRHRFNRLCYEKGSQCLKLRDFMRKPGKKKKTRTGELADFVFVFTCFLCICYVYTHGSFSVVKFSSSFSMSFFWFQKRYAIEWKNYLHNRFFVSIVLF